MAKNNELIKWTNKLACGIKVIDEQHMGLVSLVNEMFNHVTGNAVQENNYFARVAHEAVNYVKNHFSAEEKILLATKYPGYIGHKKEHDDFIQTLLESIRDYQAGKRFTLSTFTRFLKDWILSHIALVDKEYFEFFKMIATRSNNVGMLDFGLTSKNSA